MGSSITDPLALDPMAAIEAMELAAWRVAQTARQLRRDHPDLPVYDMRAASVSCGKAELDVNVNTTDDVRMWAQRVGVQPEASTRTYSPSTIGEHVIATADLNGVTVTVYATRFLSEPEREAHLARRDLELEAVDA